MKPKHVLTWQAVNIWAARQVNKGCMDPNTSLLLRLVCVCAEHYRLKPEVGARPLYTLMKTMGNFSTFQRLMDFLHLRYKMSQVESRGGSKFKWTQVSVVWILSTVKGWSHWDVSPAKSLFSSGIAHQALLSCCTTHQCHFWSKQLIRSSRSWALLLTTYFLFCCWGNSGGNNRIMANMDKKWILAVFSKEMLSNVRCLHYYNSHPKPPLFIDFLFVVIKTQSNSKSLTVAWIHFSH